LFLLLLRCLVRIFRGRIDGAQRQSLTSVGEVTAEEGREKFLCTQPESSRRPFAYETRMVPQDQPVHFCQQWTDTTTALLPYSQRERERERERERDRGRAASARFQLCLCGFLSVFPAPSKIVSPNRVPRPIFKIVKTLFSAFVLPSLMPFAVPLRARYILHSRPV
jgi:hypothetical protein